MAIRRYTKDTGLEVSDICEADTLEESEQVYFEAVQRQAAKAANWLDELEGRAAKKRVSTCEPEDVLCVARKVCDLCQKVRTLIANGAVRDVQSAFWVYGLGIEAKMLRIGHRIPDVLRGMKTRAAASQGGHKRHESARAKWPKYQPAVDAILQRNPKLSYESACQSVADNHGVNVRTVKRHTKNSRK